VRALVFKHRRLLVCYAVVGTAAGAISVGLLRLLMEYTALGHSWAFLAQFIPVLTLHYYLIRRYVIKEDHFYWRKHLPRLGVVKGLYAGAALGLYQFYLSQGLPYMFALLASQASLAIPGFLMTVLGAFKKPVVEEAKA
jgi:putative flippase GtrA